MLIRAREIATRYDARMEISQIRQQNLIRLIGTYGTMEKLALAAKTSASYLSQIKNGSRAMGTKFARTIEETLGLSRGWFDTPVAATAAGEQPVPVELALFRRLTRAQREAITLILRSMVRD